MPQEIKELQPNHLLAEVGQLKADGYRLVAITCTSKEQTEITYSFDKEDEFLNLRLVIDTITEIDSISEFYSYAFLYENEIKELFGVKINNIALDFEGNLYKISQKTPFQYEAPEGKENGDGN